MPIASGRLIFRIDREDLLPELKVAYPSANLHSIRGGADSFPRPRLHFGNLPGGKHEGDQGNRL